MTMMDRISFESILTNTTTFLLLLFTYIIPLLSSIRTIHNRDRESYNQWLTYWLLIHLLSPFLQLVKLYKIFQLSFVLWLSLPRFQGASYIYHEVVDVFLVKYNVEDKVDDKILNMKKSIKSAIWNIAQDIGWGFLYQIGGVVSYVQDSASAFVDTNSPSKQSMYLDDGDDGDDDRDYHSEEEDGNDDYHSDDDRSDYDHSDENENSIGDIGEEDEFGIIDEDPWQQHHHQQQRISQNLQKSLTASTIGNDPVHSVHESGSYSSLTSLDIDVDMDMDESFIDKDLVSVSTEEKQTYISDFINMLQKGLFVFSWYDNNDDSLIIHNGHGDGHYTSTDSTGGSNSNSDASKRFRLRVFTFYQDYDDAYDTSSSHFVFNSVESRPDEDEKDVISFPSSVITGVQKSGTHGIQFLTSSSLVSSSVSMIEDVKDINVDVSTATTMAMSQSISEPSLTKSSLLSTLSEEDNENEDCVNHDMNTNTSVSASKDPSTDIVQEDDKVIAEIVLSDDQDRNILLLGLRIFLSENSNADAVAEKQSNFGKTMTKTVRINSNDSVDEDEDEHEDENSIHSSNHRNHSNNSFDSIEVDDHGHSNPNQHNGDGDNNVTMVQNNVEDKIEKEMSLTKENVQDEQKE